MQETQIMHSYYLTTPYGTYYTSEECSTLGHSIIIPHESVAPWDTASVHLRRV